MTGPVVASAAVEIVPSAQDFYPKLRAQLIGPATRLGEDVSDEVSRPIAEKLRAAIGAGLTTDGTSKGGKTGDEFGDAFSRTVKAKIEAAFRTLPSADLTADSSDVDRKLAEIRATLLGLSDQAYIDLHVDDETTLKTLGALKAELDDLTTPDHSIRVRVDAAAAAAELAALQAQVDKLNHSVDPPGGGGIGGLGNAAEGASHGFYAYLLPAVAALSTIIGPVVAVGTAGLGTILLGAKGLEAEVKTGLTPAFKQLQTVATEALEPGVNAAVQQLKQALPQLTPLVTFFGTEIGDVADKLATWLNDGGLVGFTNYAIRELPIVEGAFEGLASAVIGFFQDVTPIGNDILRVVTGISDAVAKAEALLAKFQGSTGTGGTLPNGSPSSGLGSYVQVKSNQSILHQAEGILRNFGTSFFNPGSPVSATYGRQPNGHVAAAPFQANLHDEVNTVPASALNALNQQNAAAAAAQQIATALGTTSTSYASASTAAAAFAANTAQNTLQMQLENNAAGILQAALSALGGDTLGVAQANTAFHESITSVNSSLKTNGTTLDINTSAGQANLSSIQSAVQAARSHAEAIAQQTGSTVAATAAYNKDIATLKGQVTATGGAKSAIDGYIDSIDKLPPLKKTKIDADTSGALAAVHSLHDAVNNIPTTIPISLILSAATLGGVNLHDVTNSLGSVPTNQSQYVPHWNGGMVADGLFSVGEHGIEYGYKSGPQVQIFNPGNLSQGAAVGALANGPQQPIVIHNVTTLDGKVVAKSTNEVNLNGTRR